MAGHSKWANIQHRKGKQDAKRGKLFTKFIREITVAAKMGGSDPGSNPRLRLAVDKALGGNMTRDTIDRAIKKGAGELEDVTYLENRYEGYGTNGVAIMVDTMTDNPNRTASDVKHAFSKFGGNLGAQGSVGYLFEKQGVLAYPDDADEDVIMEAALEAGADDVLAGEDGSLEVITTEDSFIDVKETMIAAGHQPAHDEVTMRASTDVSLDVEQGEKLLKLIDALEDLDDVQNVWSNAEIPEAAYSS